MSSEVSRENKLPLYLQIKQEILSRIQSGTYPAGSLLKTEMELCGEYDVSRVTIRKALKELTDEGWLERKSGSGTFIRKKNHRDRKDNLLGLVVTRIEVDFIGNIVAGFEAHALEQGWLTVLCATGDSPDQEMKSVDELLAAGVKGVAVIPCDESQLAEREEVFREEHIPLILMDREPDLSIGYDFIGSDNFGGAYSAVRHLHNQGFYTTAFLAYKSNLSSIKERLEGYLQGVKDFSMHAFDKIDIGRKDVATFYKYQYRYFIEDLRDHIQELREHIPFGIVAVNDFIALECIKILKEVGIRIGEEAAVVGFDNIPEGAFIEPPLTTVIQNARLIGQQAAKRIIQRVDSYDLQLSRMVVPTQIMLRKSCGE